MLGKVFMIAQVGRSTELHIRFDPSLCALMCWREVGQSSRCPALDCAIMAYAMTFVFFLYLLTF